MAKTTQDMKLSTNESDFEKGIVYPVGDYQKVLEIAISNDLTDNAHRTLLEYAADTGEQLAVVWFD